jgi:hypothetical protein
MSMDSPPDGDDQIINATCPVLFPGLYHSSYSDMTGVGVQAISTDGYFMLFIRAFCI